MRIGINGTRIIQIYMMIARKVIHNVFHKEKASFSNEDVLRDFHENVNLIFIYLGVTP